jgi:hypothetical protein
MWKVAIAIVGAVFLWEAIAACTVEHYAAQVFSAPFAQINAALTK